MRGRKWKELMCLSVLLLLAAIPVVSQADVVWTAYNDCLDDVDDNTHTNVTVALVRTMPVSKFFNAPVYLPASSS